MNSVVGVLYQNALVASYKKKTNKPQIGLKCKEMVPL